MESTFSCCAYCWEEEKEWNKVLHFKCDGCRKYVHYGCIKSSHPSSLLGDSFYHFKCQSCGEENREEFHRMEMSWRQVIMLVLYNLHKTGQGRCGYFHWRAHICVFIDMHWYHIFGHHRKKTALWFGTVAGTLSSGCPSVFESGVHVVEPGYWRLVSVTAPIPVFEKSLQKSKRKRQNDTSSFEVRISERVARKPGANPLTAAIELKEKRATMTENRKKMKKTAEHSEESQETLPEASGEMKSHDHETQSESSSNVQDANEAVMKILTKGLDKSSFLSGDHDSLSISSSEVSLQTSTQYSVVDEPQSADTHSSSSAAKPAKFSSDSIRNILQQEEFDADAESDLDIDIESMVMGPLSDMKDMRPASPDVNTLLDLGQPATSVAGKSPVKKGIEPVRGHTFNRAESEGDDEKDSQGRNEMDDENSSESDMDEYEEEEGDDEEEEEGPLRDESTGTQSGREHDMVDNKANVSVSVEKKRKIGRPRKRRRDSDLPPASPPQSLKRVSLFEEGELLNKLNVMAEKQTLNPELTQLRRKLLCNKTNREFGLPVFDLDAQMEKVTSQHSLDLAIQRPGMQIADMFLPKMTSKASRVRETRDLDRFMMKDHGGKTQSRTYSRFHQRLVGLEDTDLKPFISPFTTRILMPFIWRNYNTKRQPIKMRLLQEIKSYPYRDDPTWKPEPTPPIDYCYVRPEHIPSVNALCREFFWPGIDMSECLQYPDFSCVVLYRKIVIGFAFMVPDRGFNEAYISFIFTHPEWRNVGIASFMLYHLIQTCMGKDVLLHVSASSPAMLLYQKFGFKAQEFILNFYYKYFPLNSPDSHHAFLMRLTR